MQNKLQGEGGKQKYKDTAICKLQAPAACLSSQIRMGNPAMTRLLDLCIDIGTFLIHHPVLFHRTERGEICLVKPPRQ